MPSQFSEQEYAAMARRGLVHGRGEVPNEPPPRAQMQVPAPERHVHGYNPETGRCWCGAEIFDWYEGSKVNGPPFLEELDMGSGCNVTYSGVEAS